MIRDTTLANTPTIGNMGTVNSVDQMEGGIKGSGRMANSMECRFLLNYCLEEGI